MPFILKTFLIVTDEKYAELKFLYFSLGVILILTGILMQHYYFSKLENTFEKAKNSYNNKTISSLQIDEIKT